MKAYIAGPMTNVPMFNFPAFDAAADAWRALGNVASNPHEHDQETYPGIDDCAATQVGDVLAIREEVGFDYQAAMLYDLGEVLAADAIIMLPGWQRSTGAKAERFVAEMTGRLVILAVESGCDAGYDFIEDPVQKRLTTTLIELDAVVPGFVRSTN